MSASVIIPLDSGYIFTRNFLYLLLGYPRITEYELIFITDGNNDIDYPALIKEYFPNSLFLHNEIKKGYGIVNNNAVSHTKYNNIILMNSDIILSPNCLEIMLQTLKRQDISAVQPLLIYPQTMLVQSTGHIFTQYHNAHMFENRAINDPIVQRSAYRKAITTALCAIKKSTFIELGGFDEKYFNAWEGMEFMYKITASGKRCYYNSQAVAYHIRGGARGQYKIDERPQSALFWSKWGSEITENLSCTLSQQMHSSIEGKYNLFNFSCIRNLDDVLDKLPILIENKLLYTEYAGYSQLELFKLIPYSFYELNNNIIFFVNNYKQISNNKLWFTFRKNKHDIICDLSGNCIYTSEV